MNISPIKILPRLSRTLLPGAVTIFLALVACSAGHVLSTPDEVIAAMNEAGIRCTSPRVLPIDSAQSTIRASTCTLFKPSGDIAGSVKVMTSAVSADELHAYEASYYRTPDVAAMMTFPIWIAQGDGWTVTCGSGQEQAERIAAALGGHTSSIEA